VKSPTASRGASIGENCDPEDEEEEEGGRRRRRRRRGFSAR
jgi:hypothetical protein